MDYRICDITDINKEFRERSYGIVMFDNIFEYYTNTPNLNRIKLVDNFIKNKVEPMIVENGIIQVGYGYEESSLAVSGLIGKKFEGTIRNMKKDFGELMANLRFQKEYGFVYKMMEQFPDRYRVDFINGTENVLERSLKQKDLGYVPENVVLTRVKKIG